MKMKIKYSKVLQKYYFGIPMFLHYLTPIYKRIGFDGIEHLEGLKRLKKWK
jgi:hypothetical protein